MKKILTLFTILSFAACEVIDDPIKENPTGTGTGNGDEVQKKVLLEEFTGTRCNNCPAATQIAQNLSAQYGENVILMAIHASSLANPDAKHPKDFRTPEGTELFNFFDLVGVPVGFVNRVDYPSDIGKSPGEWGTEIADILQEDALAKLEISEENYDAGSRQLQVKIQTEMLDDVLTESLFLNVFLVENDITAPQTKQDKAVEEDYVHQHLLRASFNSTYGEEIFPDGAAAGEVNERIYSLTLDGEWVKENTAVIAILYQESDFEILQAEEIEL